MQLNSELKTSARNSLTGKWADYTVITLLLMVIGNAPLPFTFTYSLWYPNDWAPNTISILWGFLCFPLAWGYDVCFLYKNEQSPAPKIKELFTGYPDFLRIAGTMFLMNLYIVLWTLLLIVPGIIKTCSYALTPFILKDNPELSYNSAIEKSMDMMRGNKWRLFLLGLSFIGWWILSLLTCGIGFLFLYPYIYMSLAKFYEDVKQDYEIEQTPVEEL